MDSESISPRDYNFIDRQSPSGWSGFEAPDGTRVARQAIVPFDSEKVTARVQLDTNHWRCKATAVRVAPEAAGDHEVLEFGSGPIEMIFIKLRVSVSPDLDMIAVPLEIELNGVVTRTARAVVVNETWMRREGINLPDNRWFDRNKITHGFSCDVYCHLDSDEMVVFDSNAVMFRRSVDAIKPFVGDGNADGRQLEVD